MLHSTAPILKLISVVLIIIAFFRMYYLFAVAGILIFASICMNCYKWRLKPSFEYTYESGNLSVIKTYPYLKNRVIVNIPITEILGCVIIVQENLPEDIPIEKCFSVADGISDTAVMIATADKKLLLDCDMYMYSLIKSQSEGV